MASQFIMQNTTSKIDILEKDQYQIDGYFHDLSPLSSLIDQSKILKNENKIELAHAVISHKNLLNIDIDAQRYSIDDDKIVICPTRNNSKLYFNSKKDSTSYMWVSINMKDIENFINNLQFIQSKIDKDIIAELLINKPFQISNYKIPSIAKESYKICKQMLNHKDDFNLQFSLLYNSNVIAQELLYNLIQEYFSKNKNQNIITRDYSNQEYIQINRVCEYIKDNIDKALTVDILIKVCGMGRSNFFSIFQKVLGVSPGEYIRKEKVIHAMELLKNKNISILEIALECGFQQETSFCRFFKQMTGYSPSTYRKEIKK